MEEGNWGWREEQESNGRVRISNGVGHERWPDSHSHVNDRKSATDMGGELGCIPGLDKDEG